MIKSTRSQDRQGVGALEFHQERAMKKDDVLSKPKCPNEILFNLKTLSDLDDF